MTQVWRTRLLWAALGSATTLLVLRVRAPTPPDAGALPVAPAAALAEVALPAPPAATRPSPPTPAPTVPTPPTAVAEREPEVPLPSRDESEPPETPANATTTSAPEYPLPTMPGMRTLRRSERFDDALGRWVISRACRVPAPASAVEAFYTRALEAHGLSVARVDEPPDEVGTRRVTLKGRGGSGKAQVAIRQPAGELSTTARIIWQPGA